MLVVFLELGSGGCLFEASSVDGVVKLRRGAEDGPAVLYARSRVTVHTLWVIGRPIVVA